MRPEAIREAEKLMEQVGWAVVKRADGLWNIRNAYGFGWLREPQYEKAVEYAMRTMAYAAQNRVDRFAVPLETKLGWAIIANDGRHLSVGHTTREAAWVAAWIAHGRRGEQPL
jgi:hypothetical protein